MHFRVFSMIAVLLAVLIPLSVQSHHPAHTSGTTTNLPYQTLNYESRRPKTVFSYSFRYDHLDNSLGDVVSNIFSGEYAFHKRFSAGISLPVISVREKFIPTADTLGDIRLNLKSLLINNIENNFFLSAGLSTSFPTGNKYRGTGSGNVIFTPSLNLAKKLGLIDLFTSLRLSVATDDQARPLLSYNLGILIPLLKEKVPVRLLLSTEGFTFIADDSFKEGSSKLFATSGFVIDWTSKVRTTLAGRFSALDTLEAKQFQGLSQDSTAILADVEAGAFINFDYFFK